MKLALDKILSARFTCASYPAETNGAERKGTDESARAREEEQRQRKRRSGRDEKEEGDSERQPQASECRARRVTAKEASVTLLSLAC